MPFPQKKKPSYRSPIIFHGLKMLYHYALRVDLKIGVSFFSSSQSFGHPSVYCGNCAAFVNLSTCAWCSSSIHPFNSRKPCICIDEFDSYFMIQRRDGFNIAGEMGAGGWIWIFKVSHRPWNETNKDHCVHGFVCERVRVWVWMELYKLNHRYVHATRTHTHDDRQCIFGIHMLCIHTYIFQWSLPMHNNRRQKFLEFKRNIELESTIKQFQCEKLFDVSRFGYSYHLFNKKDFIRFGLHLILIFWLDVFPNTFYSFCTCMHVQCIILSFFCWKIQIWSALHA